MPPSRSLRRCIAERPQDGAISNALGFILADHTRDLSRADHLISAALKTEPDNPAILDSKAGLNIGRAWLRERCRCWSARSTWIRTANIEPTGVRCCGH